MKAFQNETWPLLLHWSVMMAEKSSLSVTGEPIKWLTVKEVLLFLCACYSFMEKKRIEWKCSRLSVPYLTTCCRVNLCMHVNSVQTKPLAPCLLSKNNPSPFSMCVIVICLCVNCEELRDWEHILNQIIYASGPPQHHSCSVSNRNI